MTEIPTLTNLNDATALLRDLAAGDTHEYVSVFWDRGWGDTPGGAEISIIVDGDGQHPKAYLTADVYRQLTAKNIVGRNVYVGGKARRTHDFKTPPPVERTGPDPAEVAERVVRSVMAELHDLPIKAVFFRGFNPGDRLNPISEEVVVTAAYRGSGWYLCITPGHTDAYVVGILGFMKDAGGRQVDYPLLPGGAVDEAALRVRLVEAVRAVESAVLSARAAKVGA